MNNELIKANLSKRVGAFLIDYIVFTVISLCGINFFDNFGIGSTLFISTISLCFCLRDIFGGAGIGRRVVGIAVRHNDNSELIPSSFKLFYRNLFIFAWPIELLSLLWYGTRIGDNFAKTDVYITKQKKRNGNITSSEYGIYRNVTATTNALNETTTIEYNNLNKPIKIIQANGAVNLMSYDEYGNLTKAADPLGRETHIVVDRYGNATKITLPDGSQNCLKYDDRDNITVITDSMGAKTHYGYDSLNRVIKITKGEGASTHFVYNTRGDISKVTDAMGNVRTYEYNLMGKVTHIVDFDGGVIAYKYNKVGKIEEIIDQAGGITRLSYDKMWNVTSATNPNGETVLYEYDPFNRVIRTIDEEGNATDYGHDSNGNVISVISPLGAETKIMYDKLNRQEKVVEPDGAITKLAYDKGGNICEVTDALGNVTKREFDLAGQLVKLIDPLENATNFTYTPLGNIETITNAKGDKQTRTYYPGGKLKSIILPCGESETYEWDKNGNVVKVTDALGNATRIKYDSLDRVIEIINPLGHSKKFKYDAVGNITHMTDENGHTTQYKYSPLSDVIEVIDPTGHSTYYAYDKMRRLTEFKQLDQITTYKRNKKGEVIEVVSPLGDVVKYGLDKLGNVISKLDEDGFETLYDYNIVNKLSKISYADGKTVELTYNPLKQLTEMRDWLGKTQIELDPLGRATKVTDFEGNEVGYVWNELGQRTKLIYPDGKEVDYEFDLSGRMSKVIDGADVTNYFYDLMGRVIERILPNGVKTDYIFNAVGALSSLTHSKDGDVLDQFKYGFDPTGNITQIEKYRVGIESDNGLFKYAYDPLNRLVEAGGNRYAYDVLGNRISSLINGVEAKHYFNARNQLIKTLEGDTVTENSYDGRGNLINTVENGQQKASYTFDAANMMVGAVTQKGTASYGYDGFMNRVKKLENMTDVHYINDMTLPYDNLLNMNGQNFTWGNSLLAGSGTNIFYYLQDHLGSPIRLLGDEGNIAQVFDEFGVTKFENDTQPFGFTGYQWDKVSGLQYAQARYYSPVLGRFGAEDPIKDRINWYDYCGGNPINFIDPDGLRATTRNMGDGGGFSSSGVQPLNQNAASNATISLNNINVNSNMYRERFTTPPPPPAYIRPASPYLRDMNTSQRVTTGDFYDTSQPFSTAIHSPPLDSSSTSPVTSKSFYVERSAVPEFKNGVVVNAEAGAVRVEGDHGVVGWGASLLSADAKGGGYFNFTKPSFSAGGSAGIHLYRVDARYTVPTVYAAYASVVINPAVAVYALMATLTGNGTDWGTVTIGGSIGVGREYSLGAGFREEGFYFGLVKPKGAIATGLNFSWKPCPDN